VVEEPSAENLSRAWTLARPAIFSPSLSFFFLLLFSLFFFDVSRILFPVRRRLRSSSPFMGLSPPIFILNFPVAALLNELIELGDMLRSSRCCPDFPSTGSPLDDPGVLSKKVFPRELLKVGDFSQTRISLVFLVACPGHFSSTSLCAFWHLLSFFRLFGDAIFSGVLVRLCFLCFPGMFCLRRSGCPPMLPYQFALRTAPLHGWHIPSSNGPGVEFPESCFIASAAGVSPPPCVFPWRSSPQHKGTPASADKAVGLYLSLPLPGFCCLI